MTYVLVGGRNARVTVKVIFFFRNLISRFIIK